MRFRFAHFRLASFLLLVGSGGAGALAQAEPAAGGADRIIVFFAWDRPLVDGDAAAQLDKFAAALASPRDVRLEIAGHADRSGPAAPNARAGKQRADAVADYLASRGVARTSMNVISFGETRLLIPTADGVREPHNRRVEITVERSRAR